MAKSSLNTTRPTYAADFVKADYDRAVFLGDPMMDSMFTAFTALSANVWAVQRRLKIVEILMEKHGAVTRDMIEKYVPSAEEDAKLMAARDVFVAEVYDPFKEVGDLAYGTSLHPPGMGPQAKSDKPKSK